MLEFFGGGYASEHEAQELRAIAGAALIDEWMQEIKALLTPPKSS